MDEGRESVGIDTTAMRLRVIVYNKTRRQAGHTHFIHVDQHDSIENVKKAIEMATSVPSQLQWICFGSEHLDSARSLSSYGIREGYTIYSTPTLVEIPSIPNL